MVAGSNQNVYEVWKKMNKENFSILRSTHMELCSINE